MYERRFVRNKPRLTSVLKRLEILGIRFSHKDLVNISSLISLEYQHRYNQSPRKIKQREGSKMFFVRAFESEFLPIMDEMISLYFSKDEEKRMEIFHSARTNPSGPMARLKRKLRKRKRKAGADKIKKTEPKSEQEPKAEENTVPKSEENQEADD